MNKFRVVKCYSVFLLLWLFVFMPVNSNSVLSVKTKKYFPETTTVGILIPVTYKITANLIPLRLSFQSDANHVSEFNLVKTTCGNQLNVGETCEWKGVFTPKFIGKNSAVLRIIYPGNTETITESTNTVNEKPGELSFQKNRSAISTLPVISNSNEEIYLKNIGFSSIYEINLDINKKIIPYITGNCLDKPSLKPGDSCQLYYSIPNDPKFGEYIVTAKGMGRTVNL